jgi:iron complex outermembrane receptor protein
MKHLDRSTHYRQPCQPCQPTPPRDVGRCRLKPLPLAMLLLLGGGQAWAQNAPELADDGQPRLETVTVKAQRRSERLQDVPVSVKAFSAQQIEDTGIKNTEDFIAMTPNVSFDNSFTYGNSFVVIRGVTQVNNADSPVAVVVDGVPQNNQKQLKMNLFDVQSIEVLKGPQGALYGRNAIGGAINIETRQPRDKFEGFGGVEIGNGGARQVSAGIGGALVEDLVLLRIVGQSKQADGLIGNTYLDRKADQLDHDNAVRATLTVKASDAVNLDFRIGVTDFAAGAVWDSQINRPGAGGNPNDIRDPRSSLLGTSDGKTTDASFKAEIDTPLGVVSAITGYTKLTENYRGDIDFSNPIDNPGGFSGFGFQLGQGQNLETRMLSQELRITSPSRERLRWIAGTYYLNTRRTLQTRAFIDTNGSFDQYYDPAKLLINKNEANDNDAYAGFGQLDYDLASDLTLSGALRYDRDNRDQTDQATGLHRKRDFSDWQPKLTLTKKINPNTLSYLTYSTGFRSGGFNGPDLPDFGAEKLANYEAGAKATLLGGRLILNGALFYSKSKNFQYFYVDALTASQVIANIDKVDIKGADLDFRYLPLRDLQLDGGIGITDSKIKENRVEPGSVGNHTPKNTPFKANLGIQYGSAIGANLKGLVRFDTEYRGKKYWHTDNLAVSDALTLLNLRVGIGEAKDAWRVSAFVRNLTDKRYYADYTSARYSGLSYGAGLPMDIGSLAQPRTFGLEAKFRF